MPTPTTADINRLAARFRRTTDRRAQDRLYDEIWGAIQGLVIHVTKARHYAKPSTPWADLEQTLRLAVWEALGAYDPARGSFSAFACRVASRRLYDFLGAGGGVVAATCHASECRRRWRDASEALAYSLGREPTDDEIVASAPDERAASKLLFAQRHPEAVVVECIHDYEHDFDLEVGSVPDRTESVIDAGLLAAALDAWTAPGGVLTEMEARVLRAAAEFGSADGNGNLDLVATARALGIAVKQVDNSLLRARGRLRQAAADRGLTRESTTEEFMAVRPVRPEPAVQVYLLPDGTVWSDD